MPDISAPAAALANHGVVGSMPIKLSNPQPYKPAIAPKPMPAAHCPEGLSRAKRSLKAQAAINHANVAGRAPPVSSANRSSQSIGWLAANMAPTPTTACTKSTARNTTPTWQASNILARAGLTFASAVLTRVGVKPPCSVDSAKSKGPDDIRVAGLMADKINA